MSTSLGYLRLSMWDQNKGLVNSVWDFHNSTVAGLTSSCKWWWRVVQTAEFRATPAVCPGSASRRLYPGKEGTTFWVSQFLLALLHQPLWESHGMHRPREHIHSRVLAELYSKLAVVRTVPPLPPCTPRFYLWLDFRKWLHWIDASLLWASVIQKEGK